MVKRNESGDRIDGLKDAPPPPPTAPKPKELPPGATGTNAAGDPVFPSSKKPHNEAGDVVQTHMPATNPPAPAPRAHAPPRGLPPGAIGLNASGDPVFPASGKPQNEAGDPTSSSSAALSVPAKPACTKCKGMGKWMELDARKVLQPVVCQSCHGTKFER